MAVKNSKKKTLNANYNTIMDILRSPKFATIIDASFIEEAKTATHIEFRYVRKTTPLRYGRNYFVAVPQEDEDKTTVTITTQSRKITVFIDNAWVSEVDRAFAALEALI